MYAHQTVQHQTIQHQTIQTRPKTQTDQVVIHPIHIHLPEQTLWSTAAAPPTTSTVPVFALGTSHGLHILRGQDAHWSLMGYTVPYADRFNLDIDKQSQSDSTHVQVTSVEWLSETVVAAGLRDSTVFLHDFRSDASATRLKNPSAVSGIKKLDPWRLVVRGVDSVRVPCVWSFLLCIKSNRR